MASTNKPFPPENKISPSGWTMPEDVAGEMPPPRAEEMTDCVGLLELRWIESAPRWVGVRFALLQDGDWSTGQDDLFGGGTAPDGSWPKQTILNSKGEVMAVRPWIPRPAIGVQIPTPTTAPEAPNAGSNIKNGPKNLLQAAQEHWGGRSSSFPTPVAYDATPGGPGNHYKGLGHQAKHGSGNLIPSPTASMMTGADMVQSQYSHDDPNRPTYEEAQAIFEKDPELWRTPSARDFKGADPKNATDRQIGLNDQIKKVGNLPTPKAGSNRNSRKAIMGGHPKHPGKSDLSLEQAVEVLEGILPREVDNPDELPARFRNIFPTPNANGGLYGGQGSRQIMLRMVANGEITLEEVEAMLAADPMPTDGVRAKLWPTPQAQESGKNVDLFGEDGRYVSPGTGRDYGFGLTQAVKLDPTGPEMLPTPTAHDTGRSPEDYMEMRKNMEGGPRESVSSLSIAAKLNPTPLLPTPTGTERAGTNPNTGKGGGLSRRVKDQVGQFPTPRAGKTSGEDENTWKKRQAAGNVTTPPLGLAVRMIPTPIANDAEKRGDIDSSDPRNGLAGYSRLLPTPMASDVDKMGSYSLPRVVRPDLLWSKRKGQGKDVRSEMLPTPQARDGKSGTVSEATRNKNTRPLNEVVKSQSPYPTPRGGGGGVGLWGGEGSGKMLDRLEGEGTISPEEKKSMSSGSGGQLNPDWVEPLMGYRCDTTRLVPEVEAWLAIDSKRMKASDLKKLHDLDADAPDEDEEPAIVEPVKETKRANKKQRNKV